MKNKLNKLKHKIEDLKQAYEDNPEVLFDVLYDKAQQTFDKLKANANTDYYSVLDHNSLYYYRGKNVFKNIGKLVLKIDFHLLNIAADKKQYKDTIAMNKALRAEEDYRNYLADQESD